MTLVSLYDMFFKRAYDVGSLGEIDEYDLAIYAQSTADRGNVVRSHVRHQRSLEFRDKVPEPEKRDLQVNSQFRAIPATSKEHTMLLSPEYAPGSFVGARVAVDITGLSRPLVMCLLRALVSERAEQADFFYVEPKQYIQGERTDFGRRAGVVSQVPGFAGVHEVDSSKQLLIIGVGYEHELIRAVAGTYKAASKMSVFSLPSTQADFFQESVIQAASTEDALGENALMDAHYLPAGDPFGVARGLSDIVKKERAGQQTTDIYLAPLATKVQALGFALYYIAESAELEPTSIVFPFGSSSERRDSLGIGKVWRFSVEMDLLMAGEQRRGRDEELPKEQAEKR